MEFLPGIQVQWTDNGTLWATRSYDIISSSDDGLTWNKITTIPVPLLHRIFAKVEFLRRLLRFGIRSYIQVSHHDFIAFCDGKIFFWQSGYKRPIHIGTMRRGRGPLVQGCCQDDQGICYYGEYWRNPEREEVHVYSWNRGSCEWALYYLFPKHAIRHVHAVQFDPFSRRVWIATGDHDDECRIGYFESAASGPALQVIASGRQRTRAVSLLFTIDFVYWGTDAGGRGDAAQPNHIYRWSRRTHEIEQLAEVGDPVYYSTTDAQGRLFFATTVEGGLSQKDSFARLWKSNDGVQWQEIGQWRKDKYPFLFGYGILSFPRGQSSNSRLYVMANGVEGGLGTWTFEPNDLKTPRQLSTTNTVRRAASFGPMSHPRV